MSTILQLHENIQNKIKLAESIIDRYSLITTHTTPEGDTCCLELNSLHDERNMSMIQDCIDGMCMSVDEYTINALLVVNILDKQQSHPQVLPPKNIYNDVMFMMDTPPCAESKETFYSLDREDIVELKHIYYSTYYELPRTIFRSSWDKKARDRHSRSLAVGRPKFLLDGHMVKHASLHLFRQVIVKSNVLEIMDETVRNIEFFVQSYCGQDRLLLSDCYIGADEIAREIHREVFAYKKIHIHHRVDEDLYDLCECGNKMAIQSNSSEMMCLRCGMTTTLIGSVTEESQLFAQEGNRVAHGSYDPSRHCKFWIERIQAKESTVIPEKYISKIRESIKKDRLTNLKNISVKQFRIYLKQNDLSKLNDHIPLIKKIITGYIPPQLSHMEMQLLFIYFDKATKTYEVIKPNNKKNSLYYPFLIYKILDLIVKNDEKKKGLLSSIHLQSYETLVENDTIWQQICQENKCFEYRPTNRMH
jgi:hypothetical protein